MKSPDNTGVYEKVTPPDKKTGWKISFENTESGAGLQFLLLGRMAKARVKGVIILQTPVGWSNNYANNIHFNMSLETNLIITCAA